MIRKGRAEWRGTGRDGNGGLSTVSSPLLREYARIDHADRASK
ncbi:MAG TPA: hypothetical protein VK681_25115 [Reyranella sp.]|jgi:hypothetical protein|nr:hypothetical protein [Reyranella sp.]